MIIWAKLDPGFYSNRKVIRAGRNGREVFQFALCINAQRGAIGEIPAEDLEPWYIADQLRISEDEARDGVDRAVAAGLVTRVGNVYTIKGWDQDWSRRALSAAERAKKYREDGRNRHEPKVTRHEGVVTSHDQSDASQIREIREIRERESAHGARDSHSLSLGGSDSELRPLPADWKPDRQAVEMAADRQLDVAAEAEQFKRLARANSKLYGDPDAAFEVFLTRSKDVNKPKKKQGATTTAPKPVRVRQEDGSYVEDDGNGGYRKVQS